MITSIGNMGRDYGLEINKSKSQIIIFNMKEKQRGVEGKFMWAEVKIA